MDTTTVAQARLSDRASSALAGVLYLIGSVCGFATVAIIGGQLDGPDYLSGAAELGQSLAVAALIIMIMGLSLAGIPLVLFSILRRVSERLAVGYVVFRSALETVATLMIALSWLLLFQLGGEALSSAEAPQLNTESAIVHHAGETAGTLGSLFFITGAVMFYAMLYQARLVPRWLSVWGLLALIPYLVVAVLGLLGSLDVLSGPAVALQAPLALQELVLALWLIFRGLSSAVPSTPKNAALV